MYTSLVVSGSDMMYRHASCGYNYNVLLNI